MSKCTAVASFTFSCLAVSSWWNQKYLIRIDCCIKTCRNKEKRSLLKTICFSGLSCYDDPRGAHIQQQSGHAEPWKDGRGQRGCMSLYQISRRRRRKRMKKRVVCMSQFTVCYCILPLDCHAWQQRSHVRLFLVNGSSSSAHPVPRHLLLSDDDQQEVKGCNCGAELWLFRQRCRNTQWRAASAVRRLPRRFLQVLLVLHHSLTNGLYWDQACQTC